MCVWGGGGCQPEYMHNIYIHIQYSCIYRNTYYRYIIYIYILYNSDIVYKLKIDCSFKTNSSIVNMMNKRYSIIGCAKKWHLRMF